MPHLKATGLGHTHDGEPLFTGLDLTLNPGDRLGVVGPNGAGKTTLLRILAGDLTPTHGVVTAGTRIGYVPQRMPDPHGTVGGWLAGGLGEIGRVTARMRELEQRLAAEDVLDEYAAVQDRWTALRGWTTDTRLAEIRQRLSLGHLPDDRRLDQVSGGEQARLLLARALLDDPGLLLLDEPTNHLDSDGTTWLRQWLAGYHGAVLAVSHDRAFLDETVTRIIELDGIDQTPQDYPGGGYTHYREQKQKRWERLLLDYEAQEKDRRRWEADIATTKAHALGVENTVRSGATAPHLRRVARLVARKAKVRERRLRRQMAAVSWIARPRTRPPVTLAFPGDTAGTGDVLLHVRGRAVTRGDRILITGRNGSGKTTLLREIAGEHPGTVAVLPQTDDGLRDATTVMDFFRARVPVYIDDAETLLTGHQFDTDQWDSPVQDLSSGELRRLLLAVLVNSPARILLLDEPTNHLDFAALDVIEHALRRYRGTLLFASHDRYFADTVGHTRHWHVDDGQVTGD
ncbi:ABC-F family ATP-binding cassette domain-containing protein [Actinoplanes sp. G11-F43]|uniref:ABC-F family ATP-binding cassette domain-containing protein n=1 Tax=Actinoplanes sp. G11-F43 TaxID=3424130 RepID=UPI003D356606